MNDSILVELPQLHPLQKMVYDDPSRFKVLSCGRRWGKTLLLELVAVYAAIQENKRVWWVSPISSISDIAWRGITSLTKDLIEYKNETKRYLIFPGGGEIWFKSADNPNNLRGESLDLVIFDEAAFVAPYVWPRVIRPMLADRQGKAWFISTPNGINWFYDIYKLGKEDKGKWKSWKFPTSTNPYIKQEEIDDAENTLPEHEFLQEWCAEFLGDGLSIFKNIDTVCCLNKQPPIDNHVYVAGIDWGFNDYTVISIIDANSKEQVYLERFNKIDFALQITKLEAICKRYRVIRILAEKNSIGLPNSQSLRARGLPVELFETTNETKQQMVHSLLYAMENLTIKLLKDENLIGELKSFIGTRTETGKWQYKASRGHDDMVMATLLAHFLIVYNPVATPSSIAKSTPRLAIASINKKHRVNESRPLSGYLDNQVGINYKYG